MNDGFISYLMSKCNSGLTIWCNERCNFSGRFQAPLISRKALQNFQGTESPFAKLSVYPLGPPFPVCSLTEFALAFVRSRGSIIHPVYFSFLVYSFQAARPVKIVSFAGFSSSFYFILRCHARFLRLRTCVSIFFLLLFLFLNNYCTCTCVSLLSVFARFRSEFSG